MPVPTGSHAIDWYPAEQQAFGGLILPLLQGTYVSDVQRAGFLFTEKYPNNSNSATTSQQVTMVTSSTTHSNDADHLAIEVMKVREEIKSSVALFIPSII
ncbi:hypothetical protein DPMN_037285 [Dreissena polymorpha]|uniref:Uncharacterized protein n=1 Tax=Dreissena polymorpha TaxID=45954 RepID=A0A9D4ME78_DREPO|nr:hypothetical protein DPMN_037285 [Dreissena polymorpha]